jgi:hypothetical protein
VVAKMTAVGGDVAVDPVAMQSEVEGHETL